MIKQLSLSDLQVALYGEHFRMSEMPNGTPVEAYRSLLPDKWAKKKQGE